VQPFAKPNHAPSVKFYHVNSLRAKPGKRVQLNGSAKDPDGNSVNFKWWQYFEADTYPGKVNIIDSDKSKAFFTIPPDAS